MQAIVYDHNISESRKFDYYISINYIDKKSNSKNYIYLNKYISKLNFFDIATHDIYNFSNKKFDDKTIKEIISFDGISLWWFYELPIRSKYIEYLKYQNMLGNLLSDINITHIKCDVQDPIILLAIHNYCAEKKLRFEKIIHKNISVNKYLRYIDFGLKYLATTLISKIYNTKVQASVIIASYTISWIQYRGPKDVPKDVTFHEIQQKLEESNINYQGIEENNESIRNYIKTRVEKRKYEKDRWLPLTAYIHLNIIFKSIKIHKDINSKLSAISMKNSNDEFILNLLNNCIKESIFTIMGIYCFSDAIDKIKPRVILTTCEYCEIGRIATIVGNRKNMITMALQHGMINDTHWGYIFHKSEKTSYTSAINLRPIPRYTILHGTKHKDILINNSTYPPESLIVTGQPEYDYFYNITTLVDKELFIKENNLKRPLIVWIAQSHGLSKIENEKNIECFLNLLNNNAKINLFIKPHPGETDLSIYNPLVNCQNVILSKYVNLYELLYTCDLIITKNSTTAMGAVALNKPVIVLNLSEEPDIVDYMEQGVALGVYRAEDLKLSIEKLLKDDSELARNREKYIEKYLYKIDGKSTERVVKIIKEMINEEQKKNNI